MRALHGMLRGGSECVVEVGGGGGGGGWSLGDGGVSIVVFVLVVGKDGEVMGCTRF